MFQEFGSPFQKIRSPISLIVVMIFYTEFSIRKDVIKDVCQYYRGY